MKKIVHSVVVAAISLSTVAFADVKVGSGVALTSNGSSVKVPLDINSKMRVEPEVAFGYKSDGDNSYTNFGLMAGVYLMSQPAKKINLFYGGKLGFSVSSSKVGSVSNSDTIVNLIPTAGFEYFLDPKVSVGGEAGFGFGFGDVTNIGLTTATTLRYYF